MTARRDEAKGPRAGRRRPNRRLPLLVGCLSLGALSLGALSLGALSLGCIANPIRVDARDPAVLDDTSRFFVSLAPTTAGAAPTTDEATTASLLDRAEDALVRKGYAIEGPETSDLMLELSLRKERVSRKTYSSDPDASGVRMVERTEAILTLRAIDPRRGVEIWRCDARGRLPEPELAFVESESELWHTLLERALDEVPARR